MKKLMLVVGLLGLMMAGAADVHGATCAGANGECHACKNCSSCANCAKRGGTCSVCRKR